MANSKISTLTSATTPLAGTETLPVVQSSTTKQVSVANLTAGRAVSAASLSLTTTPLPVSSGGTGLSTLTAGYIPFGAGTSAFGNSASLFWDSANTRLGVGTAAPAAKIHASLTYVTPATSGISADTVGIFSNNNVASGSTNVSILSRSSGFQRLYFGNQTIENAQYIESFGSATGYMAFGVSASPSSASGTERMRITNTGGVSIATTTDAGAGNLLMGTGNLVQGTAAKGVNFTANTPAAGMTSQLLNWYEEGTWTPSQGSGLTVVGAFSSTGKYTRNGRNVTISGTVTGATSVAVAAAGIITTNLPFTVGTAGHGNITNAALTSFSAIICTSTNVTSAGAIAATGTLTFSATYFV